MDNGERAEAANGANRRSGLSGTPPAQRSGVLGGRQVHEAPEAGSSLSRLEPHGTQKSACTVRRPLTLAAREGSATGRRSQPYSEAERTGHPGAARLLPFGQSGAPAQGPSRPERKLRAGFNWTTAYHGIKMWREGHTQSGDVYASAAGSSALQEIDRAVIDAYIENLQNDPPHKLPTPEDALQRLRNLASRAKIRNQQDRYVRIVQSLEAIYRLTQAKKEELGLRSDEFSGTSHLHPVVVLNRQALGQWLLDQAVLSYASEIECSYFTQLARELAQGLDPWTVSRRLIVQLPVPGDAQQAERLRAAHGRLVRSMTGSLSDQAAPPPGPGGTELPIGFRWSGAYLDIKLRREACTSRGDAYAAAAAANAIREVDGAVMAADARYRERSSRLKPPSPEETISSLKRKRASAESHGQKDRSEAIARSLDGIYRLTHAKDMELRMRTREFRSVSLSHAGAVPDQLSLGQWLRGQADAAHESETERSYFTQLARELALGFDPWTASRRLIGPLPEPGDAEQGRLQDAHRRLLNFMAGGPPQPQAPLRPGPPAAARPLSRENQAPASRRQRIVQRLRGGFRLSEALVEAFRLAVAEAARSGTLGASGSRPEASAMNLLERIQQSADKPLAVFTELELDRVSSDWTQFDALLESLESAGHL